MTNPNEGLASLIADLRKRLHDLETTVQMSSSTVSDEDDASTVEDIVSDAAVTSDALPDLQDDIADANDGVSALGTQIDAQMLELDARLELGDTNLAAAREELEASAQDIRDAFGQEITGLSDRIDQIVVGAGGTLILYSDFAPTPDDKAPPGSTWWMINAADNVAGQWQQTGTADVPVWTPRQIESEVFANLDVAKLTAGQAALAQVVAMKIAASTADIQTVNLANLFVTDGATMSQATINFLFANVVAAKKITADMLDVNSLNGVTITGAIIKSAATGQRLELQKTSMLFYSATSTAAVGGIFAEDRGVFSSVTIQNFYGSEPSFATFDVPRNPSAGAYESSRKLNLGLSHGLAAPVIQVKQLFGSGDYGGRKYPVIDSTLVNGFYAGMVVNADEFRLGTNDPRSVISRTNGDAASPTSVQVTADKFARPDGSSVLPLTGIATYSGTLAANSSDTMTVTFPVGQFTTPPLVNANGSNSRVTIGINSVTKDAVTFALGNWTSGATSAFTVHYTATPRV